MNKITIKTPDGKVKRWVAKGKYLSSKQWKEITDEILKLLRESDVYIKEG